MDEVKGYLAEVIEMIASGTCEDQKAVTSVLVGPTIVKGRHSIRPSFILPTQKGSRSAKGGAPRLTECELWRHRGRRSG